MSLEIEQVFSDVIRKLTAYKVAPSDGLIKLDAMENPFSMPAEWTASWLAELQNASLNRYPDPAAEALSAQLRQHMLVPEDKAMILGNGSDELIQLLCMSLINSPLQGPNGKAVVMAPEPGFVMYRLLTAAVGCEYVSVPLRAQDFSLDMPAMLAAITKYRPAIVFLAYPNNPTGNLFEQHELIEIIEQAPGLVVIDEAYQPFAQQSFMSQLSQYDNLLVMRTVSKLGLAGIRLGLLAGAQQWIDELNKLRLPYNINILTQVTALHALQHADVFAMQAQTIREQRCYLFDVLSTMPGVEAYPSHANFILFRVPTGQGEHVFNALKSQGILIKNLSAIRPLLSDCLRVTVGTEQENTVFIKALSETLQSIT